MNRSASAAGAAWLALLAFAAGCGERPRPTAAVPPPFADCATLAAPPSPAGGSPFGSPAVAASLPALTLPCLTGGAAVGTGALAGPLLVNLWATWCPPCRAELPLLQRFADRTPGVRVVGVVTSDNPDWAADLGRELGLRFPQLVDRDGALQRALGAVGLPATVLVAADGRPRYLHAAPLTETSLAALAATHLGVRP